MPLRCAQELQGKYPHMFMVLGLMENRYDGIWDPLLLTMIASHTQVNLFGSPVHRVKADKGFEALHSVKTQLPTGRNVQTVGRFFFQNCTCTLVRLSNINLDSLTQRGLLIFGWSPLPTFQVTAIQLEISRTKAVIYNCQCMQRLKPRVRTDSGIKLPLKLHMVVNKVNLPVQVHAYRTLNIK